MDKFLNKKEQVFDLQLTTYGRQMLSVGNFRPSYYAFFDDNVIYDSKYTALPHGTLNRKGEAQNDIHNRIKNETSYLEGLTLFESVEDTLQDSGGTIYDGELSDSKKKPRKDLFRFDSAIGDAFLDGDADLAPAWKVVALQSQISGSTTKDIIRNTNVPQIEIEALYSLKVEEGLYDPSPKGIRDLESSTSNFPDGNRIRLVSADPLIYTEELNTQLLTENFNIEVYEVLTGSIGGESLERKFFEKYKPQIVDGIMVSPMLIQNPEQELTTDSVEYYFDLLTDNEVNQDLACKGAEIFNRKSYYIDLDFDCDASESEKVYYDIYGSVTEPEICD